MKIKIPVKGVSSNKDQTLPENPASTVTSTTPVSGLVPFVDKIAIVVTPPTFEDRKAIHSAFFTHADDKSLMTDTKPIKGYQIGKRIVLGSPYDPKAYPHLCVKIEDQLLRRLRLEFAPEDLGKAGMVELHAALVPLLPDGWPYVLNNGQATRIEVTVDIPKVSMTEIHVLPSTVTSAMTWTNNGTLETLVLGKAKSKSQLRIYDRGKKRKKNNQFSPDYEGVRVERIYGLARPMLQLPILPNPFAGLHLTVMPPKPPHEPKEYVWMMFTDSVARRSLPVALKLLPEAKRTLYRQWFKQNAAAFWDPDEIWKTWPDRVREALVLDQK